MDVSNFISHVYSFNLQIFFNERREIEITVRIWKIKTWIIDVKSSYIIIFD